MCNKDLFSFSVHIAANGKAEAIEVMMGTRGKKGEKGGGRSK